MNKGDEEVVEKVIRLADCRFVSEIPAKAGELVATCIYNDKLIVACQYGVFRLENDVLVQIKFKK